MGQLLLSFAVIVGTLSGQGDRAIAQTPLCPDPGSILATETTRILELPQFGLSLAIPENFRAILRNNGAVEIVNPGTYQVLHCVAEGGRALGRGYSSVIVRSQPKADNINLRQFVENTTRLNGDITPYSWQGQQGYLVRALADQSAQFWFASNSQSEVVVISSGCDCRGMLDQLLAVLERTSPLE
ncbi:MAG TPA: hypothetical protein V6D29_16485 [Leptolyngbyaceae cyanobacterium]